MPKVYECKTHGVIVKIDGNRREHILPEGSLYKIPNCYLIKSKVLAQGTHGDCVIVERASEGGGGQ